MKMPTVTYTNQVIAIAKDLIFGWCILSEDGWVPLSDGTAEDLEMVRKQLYNPIFPDEVRQHVRTLIEEMNTATV